MKASMDVVDEVDVVDSVDPGVDRLVLTARICLPCKSLRSLCQVTSGFCLAKIRLLDIAGLSPSTRLPADRLVVAHASGIIATMLKLWRMLYASPAG